MNFLCKTAIAIGVCCTLSGCWTTENGTKAGVITKIAKQGAFWGTYEGELIRGGLADGSGATGRSFKFTLGQSKNVNVVKSLELLDKNKPVTIQYHCEAFVAPWRGESKCFLDKVSEHE